MKTLRTELYAFVDHCYKKGMIDNDAATVLNYEIEVYNSDAPTESRNVATHEAKQKVYKSENVKPDYVSATFDETRPPDKAR